MASQSPKQPILKARTTSKNQPSEVKLKSKTSVPEIETHVYSKNVVKEEKKEPAKDIKLKESKKLKNSRAIAPKTAEVVAYEDSYQMESMEMMADLHISAGAGASQIPEPHHRGLEGNQLPDQVLKSTEPSAFPFEKYHAEVTGTDTLHVTIPRRYLRRLSRDWIEYGGTILDTIENDSNVILKLTRN